jgi:uncharacterized protein
MRFDNSFEVAGAPSEVITLFENLPLMTGFLPGASVGERNPDGSYPATLVVSFGPKRIAFRGTVTSHADTAALSGTVDGHASADIRGAKMSVSMHYQLAPSAAGTQVTLVSEAEMTGMLAEFARTGGVAITSALLAEFAGNFSAHVRALQHPPAPDGPPAPAPPAAAGSLSVFKLLRQMLKSALRSLRPGSRS